MSETAYISGPMRGIVEYNYPQFHAVDVAWREQHPDHRVFNPANNFGGDKSLDIATYMDADLRQVLDSTVLVMLPQWWHSQGARLEAKVGLATGKRFFIAEQGYDIESHKRSWEFAELDEWEVKAGIEGQSPWSIGGHGTALPVYPSAQEADRIIEGVDIEADVAGYDALAKPALPDTPRKQSLERAISYVCQDRNASYGPPTQDFKRTADMWSAFGFRFVPHEDAEPEHIRAHHIANAMILLKQSRTAWQPEKADSWDDTSGYAACGHECVVEEGKA